MKQYFRCLKNQTCSEDMSSYNCCFYCNEYDDCISRCMDTCQKLKDYYEEKNNDTMYELRR